jgi:hypothetical protein
VFVDHYGDLHDPEYRHFPVVVNSKPKWERDHGLIDEDDEDEDGDEDDVGRPFAFGGVFPSRKPVPAFRPSYAYSSYHHYDVPYPSPSSYESNALAATVEDIDESPFGDAEEKEVKASTRKARRHGRSKTKTKTVEEKEGLAAAEESAPEAQEKDNEWTPTCSESIRREWQAITLSLRFSVFRLKRKIKRRLATG